MTSPSVGSSLLRLSLSGQLLVIMLLYSVALGLIWAAGEGTLALHEAVEATFDPEGRADDLLGQHVTAPHPDQLRRYLEALETRTGSEGRLQLRKPEPNFAVVLTNLREQRTPFWVPSLRNTLSYVLPRDVQEPVDRLEAEGSEILGRLAATIAALHRENAGRSPRQVRATAEGQRQLAELVTLSKDFKTGREVAASRLRRWQRDVALGASAVALGLAVVVGFLGARAVRRAAARLRAHVTEVEQGNFGWRVVSASDDALAPVTAAFNEMAATVERAAHKAEEDARQAGKALRELENIMETIPDVLCILDLLGRLDLWNQSLQRATGQSAQDLTGSYMHDLFSEADRGAIQAAVREGLRHGRFEVEGKLRGPEGTERPYHWTGAVLADANGDLIGLTVSGRDITERKALERKLARQAFHDPLTALPNRALFMNRLTHSLARNARRPEAVAVLFVDLDRFKVINDSLGHQAGDALLVEVSARLRECVRPGDTVARLGGDEFAVLLEDLESLSEAPLVAERIAATVAKPFVCEGREVFVTTSVGIAFSRAGITGPEELLRDADVAMYSAKSKGKARYEVFDSRAQGSALDRLDLEIDLRAAVTRQEFRLHYQPIVDLSTNRIVEVEALIRWEHRQRGLLPPSDFITLSEETGLIVPIGMWVLEAACRQARAWQTEHGMPLPLVLSVNLSARQFQQPSLVPDIARLLQDTGLPPRCLKLEITESTVMHDAAVTLARLHALKELGVQLAVDDFGTGYSSLSYLKRFPIDVLKIDQGFVRGLGENPEDTAIVRAIVTVAKNLDLSVTAEGIETDAQLNHLRALGCDRGQGYYFARPLPADPFSSLFARGLDRHRALTGHTVEVLQTLP